MLVLIFSVQLCIHTFAADAQKTAEPDGIGLLDALGIAEENSENGDELISRAEFLAHVLAAVRETWVTESDYPVFNDVTVNHRYYNEIVYAFQKGYISGAGDRRFYPDDYISFAEAGVIMVNALGYKSVAMSNGYLGVETGLDLYKGCGYSQSAPVSRRNAKVLLYNMLMSKCPEASYTKTGSEIGYGTETLLERVWNIYTAQGIVNAAGIWSVISDYEYGSGKAVIGRTEYDAKVFPMERFFGQNVKLYFEDNDSGKSIVYAYPSNNREKIFESEDYVEADGNSLKFEKNNRILTFNIDSDANILWNFKPMSFREAKTKLGAKGTEYRLIDNDRDGRYETVILLKADVYSGGFIDKERYVISDSNLPALELKRYSECFLRNESGADISIAEMKKEWRYLVYNSEDYGFPILVSAVESYSEGKAEEINEKKRTVKLDNEEILKLSYCCKTEPSELETGKTYRFYSAPNGLVIDIEATGGSGYEAVYIISRSIDDFSGSKVKLLNEKGEKEICAVSRSVTLTDKNGEVHSGISPRELFNILDAENSALSKFVFVRRGASGELKRVIQVTDDTDKPYHKQDFEQMTSNNARRWLSARFSLENQIQLKGNTKIFIVPYSDLSAQDEKYYSVAGTEIFKNNETYRINECNPRVEDQLIGTPVVLEAGEMNADYFVVECAKGKGLDASATKYGLVVGFYNTYDSGTDETYKMIRMLDHAGNEISMKYSFTDDDFVQVGDMIQIRDTGSEATEDDVLIYYDRDKDKINYFSFYDKGTGTNEIGWRYYAGFRVTKGRVLKKTGNTAYCEVMRDNETTFVKEYISMDNGKIISFRDSGREEYTVKNIGYLEEGDEFLAAMSNGGFLYIVEN